MLDFVPFTLQFLLVRCNFQRTESILNAFWPFFVIIISTICQIKSVKSYTWTSYHERTHTFYLLFFVIYTLGILFSPQHTQHLHCNDVED